MLGIVFFFVSELLQAAIIKLLRWLFSLLWTIDYRLPINSKWTIPSVYTLWDTSYFINSYWHQVTTIIITPLQTITALIEIISINSLSIHEPKHFSVQFHRPGMYNMIDNTNVVGFFVGFLAGWNKDMCIYYGRFGPSVQPMSYSSRNIVAGHFVLHHINGARLIMQLNKLISHHFPTAGWSSNFNGKPERSSLSRMLLRLAGCLGFLSTLFTVRLYTNDWMS